MSKLEAAQHSDSTHAHNHHAHASEAEGIVNALTGRGDRGAFVALLGLLTNVGLTIVKGAAGWYLNSSVLVADAGHSLSDLLGDLVTLVFYTVSRWPPSSTYPYGYGKFESIGTATVAVFLMLGAWAIGWHSLSQVWAALPFLDSYLPPSLVMDLAQGVEEEGSDPNAAWVAVLGIVVKEFMYRLSAAVAKSENSPVIMANAMHHRSDMYTCVLSLVAILGGWYFPHLPLDPIGGLLVTALIAHQAVEFFTTATYELTDHSIPTDDLEEVRTFILYTLGSGATSYKMTITDVRGIRRGAHLHIDATLDIDEKDSERLTVRELVTLNDSLMREVKVARKDVKEIRLRFDPIS